MSTCNNFEPIQRMRAHVQDFFVGVTLLLSFSAPRNSNMHLYRVLSLVVMSHGGASSELVLSSAAHPVQQLYIFSCWFICRQTVVM